MDKEFYFEKSVRRDHLDSNTYIEFDGDSDKRAFSKLKRLIYKHAKCLTKKKHQYLTHYQWKLTFMSCQKYINAKKFSKKLKNPMKVRSKWNHLITGRPVIAGPNSPTQRLSFLLEKVWTPLVTKLKSYIKDYWDFSKKLLIN